MSAAFFILGCLALVGGLSRLDVGNHASGWAACAFAAGSLMIAVGLHVYNARQYQRLRNQQVGEPHA